MKSNVNNVEEIIVVADNAKVKKTVKDSVLLIYSEIQSICFNYIRLFIRKIKM